MEGTAKWIAGGLGAALGLAGLFVAANARDRGIYVFGLGLAAFAIVYVFAQMKQGFDAGDRARSARASRHGIHRDERGIIGEVTP